MSNGKGEEKLKERGKVEQKGRQGQNGIRKEGIEEKGRKGKE